MLRLPVLLVRRACFACRFAPVMRSMPCRVDSRGGTASVQLCRF